MTPMADGLVGPYETSLQVDTDKEEVPADEPAGSVGTPPSSHSGVHSFGEDGSIVTTEAEEEQTGIGILPVDLTCDDYELSQMDPVGSPFCIARWARQDCFPIVPREYVVRHSSERSALACRQMPKRITSFYDQ